MTTVTIHHAKTNLSRLIAEIENGGEIIIARGQVPVARLTSLKPKPPRVPGMYAHLGPIPDGAWDPLPEEELAAWEGAYSRSLEPDGDR